VELELENKKERFYKKLKMEVVSAILKILLEKNLVIPDSIVQVTTVCQKKSGHIYYIAIEH